jgi:hypothetical protein
MQQLFAIIGLTWKAAFRYRLFWVIVVLLLGAVVGLPLLIKHDGTAEGFAQILITYTLGAVTALLGLCTLWLACGTLARDVEECQIQLVLVKPVARWKVWLGKWLGLVTLNAALLAVAGTSIYVLIEWRARNLAPEELFKLQNQVLVARASAKPDRMDKYIQTETARRLQELIDQNKLGGANKDAVAQRIRDQVKAELQVVGPDKTRYWLVHLDTSTNRLDGQPLYLRVKFNASQNSASGTYYAEWLVANPQTRLAWPSDPMSLAPETFHEFAVPSSLVDDKGDVAIVFHNPANQAALLFPLDDGMEVLYRVGGFAANLIRGMGIILCWMALLAALGLAAASFLSFPVAAFCSLAILTLGLSSGTLSNVVSEGTIMGANENGVRTSAAVDSVMVPVFGAMLKLINLVQQFSPVDSLSTGRNVSWAELGLAAAQIVLLLGGILGVFGVFVFYRRELATAAATH